MADAPLVACTCACPPFHRNATLRRRKLNRYLVVAEALVVHKNIAVGAHYHMVGDVGEAELVSQFACDTTVRHIVELALLEGLSLLNALNIEQDYIRLVAIGPGELVQLVGRRLASASPGGVELEKQQSRVTSRE